MELPHNHLYWYFFSLAVSPIGIGLWVEVYSGTQLYYEDRGVSVYTTYIYRLTTRNDYGFVTSANSSTVVTHGGQPFEPPALTVTAISHTILKADWTVPGKPVIQPIACARSMAYTGFFENS